jgi:uncharacterized RDD family membrane protein YckC
VTFNGGAELVLAELQRGDPLGHELLGVGEVDQLAQPLGEQERRLVGLDLQLARRPRPAPVPDELGKGRERLAENRLLRRRFDLELELRRVLDPAKHDASGAPLGEPEDEERDQADQGDDSEENRTDRADDQERGLFPLALRDAPRDRLRSGCLLASDLATAAQPRDRKPEAAQPGLGLLVGRSGDEDLVGGKECKRVLDGEQRVALPDLGLDLRIDRSCGPVGELSGLGASLVLLAGQPLERAYVRRRRDDVDIDVRALISFGDRLPDLVLRDWVERNEEYVPCTHDLYLPGFRQDYSDVKTRTDWELDSGATWGYEDPTHRYVARFATPWRRTAAAAIDWGLCFVAFLIVSIPLGIVQSVGTISREDDDLGGVPGHVIEVATQLATVVPVVAYFALLWPTSQTFGMRATDLRTVSIRTGRGPSYLAAGIRAVLATVIAAAVYAVYLNSTDYGTSRELDDTSKFLLDIAYGIAAVGGISALVMLVTRTRRSLLDRLFGTVVLDDLEPTAPRSGPWGTLDAFDTAHRRP